MLNALIEIFAFVVGLLVSLIPVGPDIPAFVGAFIFDVVGFAKGMEVLVGTSHALICISIITVYEVGMAGFRSVVWVYNRIRGA